MVKYWRFGERIELKKELSRFGLLPESARDAGRSRDEGLPAGASLAETLLAAEAAVEAVTEEEAPGAVAPPGGLRRCSDLLFSIGKPMLTVGVGSVHREGDLQGTSRTSVSISHLVVINKIIWFSKGGINQSPSSVLHMGMFFELIWINCGIVLAS